jgi:hypothetical protein
MEFAIRGGGVQTQIPSFLKQMLGMQGVQIFSYSDSEKILASLDWP